MTQKALADRTGFSPSYITMLERGVRVPAVDSVQAFAAALMLSPPQSAHLATAARRQRRLATGATWPPDTWEIGEAPALPDLCGREADLVKLEGWLTDRACRVAAILGMGGVGKTALAAGVLERTQEAFDCVVWRSLRHAPPLAALLAGCIQVLSDRRHVVMPDGDERGIALLLEYLRRQRCLLVLDDVSALLRRGERAGTYRVGYESYGRLIARFGEAEHASCLLLTSRERLRELVRLGGAPGPVRTLRLGGLGHAEGRLLLDHHGLVGSEEEWVRLIAMYDGNPLALQLIAETVRDLFGGSIAAFLEEGEAMMGGVRELIAGQVACLSPLEREIVYWLAVERKPISPAELSAAVPWPVSRVQILEALESLQRRHLIGNNSFALCSLQPMVPRYMTSRLVLPPSTDRRPRRTGCRGVAHAARRRPWRHGAPS
jgi:transcriptional regulator with XRE-family HTH domain